MSSFNAEQHCGSSIGVKRPRRNALRPDSVEYDWLRDFSLAHSLSTTSLTGRSIDRDSEHTAVFQSDVEPESVTVDNDCNPNVCIPVDLQRNQHLNSNEAIIRSVVQLVLSDATSIIERQ